QLKSNFSIPNRHKSKIKGEFADLVIPDLLTSYKNLRKENESLKEIIREELNVDNEYIDEILEGKKFIKWIDQHIEESKEFEK
ncbi:MAG: hypothetical protein LBD63_00620, partial [Mycoplasmataceae bacterium]|nr:hypothetical protein [Mycoplasmataceae bacterium]